MQMTFENRLHPSLQPQVYFVHILLAKDFGIVCDHCMEIPWSYLKIAVKGYFD